MELSLSRTMEPGKDCLPCFPSRISNEGGREPDRSAACSSSARLTLEEKNASRELSAAAMRAENNDARERENDTVRKAGGIVTDRRRDENRGR